ncbi:MAG: hypothetical protein COW30_14430 [Rhodospirillales bacterium CG15_BIG_FIL_POST_REV_8_21_14_020_66_15]|nr:MAG: hypothetical protein COW30_14430 [Rhodospirillales bacterium CG15_BIG_FIL_POST_REV_8_21_14_020_66_15]
MNTNPSDNRSVTPVSGLTVEDFLVLGADTTAFVKAIEIDGRAAYGIFSALGQPLGYADTRAVAQVAVRQNDLEPASVH